MPSAFLSASTGVPTVEVTFSSEGTLGAALEAATSLASSSTTSTALSASAVAPGEAAEAQQDGQEAEQQVSFADKVKEL